MPLMRPRQGRWLTGVCKGIALHLGIGVAWVRIAFIALTVLYGAGIIAYVFLWVFMPAGDPVAAAARTVPVNQAPLARGNQPLAAHDDESAAAPESLSEAIQRAPKPAVVALAGFALMATGLLLTSTGADVQIVFPLLVGLGGIALAWMNLSPRGTQLLSMLGGIALIFMGWALYVHNVSIPGWGTSPRRIVASGFVMIVGIVVAVMPWANAMLQRLTHEQALKEREEERADMTAHLHDGVLQTLALIQLNSEEPTTVFALARSQERELREWLYQERSTSDRSVGAGLKQIAAEVEDEHGKPIEVVTVCLCSISCCGFSHDDFSGLGRACRPRNGLNWMVLVSPPERTGKDYDQHAPSTVYPSFAAERGIRRVDRAENTCQRADGA